MKNKVNFFSIFITIFFSMVFFFPKNANAETIFLDNLNLQETNGRPTNATRFWGQMINIPANEITKISFHIERDGQTGTFNLVIYETDSNHTPTGQPIFTSENIDLFGTGFQLYEYTPQTPIAITPNIEHGIFFQTAVEDIYIGQATPESQLDGLGFSYIYYLDLSLDNYDEFNSFTMQIIGNETTATTTPPTATTTPTTTIFSLCEIPENSLIQRITGCQNIYTTSTTTPNETRYFYYDIPIILLFVFLVFCFSPLIIIVIYIFMKK